MSDHSNLEFGRRLAYSVDNSYHAVVNACTRSRAIEEDRFCVIDDYLELRRLWLESVGGSDSGERATCI